MTLYSANMAQISSTKREGESDKKGIKRVEGGVARKVLCSTEKGSIFACTLNNSGKGL